MTHSNKSFKDLLPKPEETVVLRHAPWSGRYYKRPDWELMIENNPSLFNEYQQTQLSEKVAVNEMLSNAQFVASFIGHGRGKAKFVGLYERMGSPSKDTIRGCRQDMETILSNMERFRIMGGVDFLAENEDTIVSRYVFKIIEKFLPDQRGVMVINWTCGDRNWFRPANKDEFPLFITA